MAVPKKLKFVGTVTLGPCQSTCAAFPSADYTSQLLQEMTTQADVQFARDINSPAAFVDLLAGTGITAVRAYVLKITGGALDVRVSSSSGADQLKRCSDLEIWISRTLGAEITALAVRGTASIEVMIVS